jgi:hypothetical protein
MAKVAISTGKMSSPDKPKVPPFIFLMGDTGSGKTFSLGQMSNYGEVILLDIDQNAGGITTRKDVNLDNIEHVTIGGRAGTEQGVGEALDAYLIALTKDIKSGDRPTPGLVALDSITTLAVSIMHDVLAKGNRTNTPAQLQDYGIQQQHLLRFALMIGSIPVRFGSVIIGHTLYEKDEASGRMIQSIAGLGQALPPKLLRFFSEIYFADTEVNKAGNTFIWRTQRTTRYNVRTQLGLADPIPQDFTIPFAAYYGDGWEKR